MADTSSEAHHQACPECGGAVSVETAEPLARVACPHCGARFHVASMFDYFELVETVGVGGMGSVYKARDTRLDRFVALKLLRKELSANPEEAAQLEQEARVTAAINHPNVVQVYSTGTANGQIYLVMELVDHGSLDDLMAQHTRVPEAQVLETGIQVAKGLQAAHEKGLIHRDIKPANILFSDAQTAKIGDFGLAVAAGQQAEAQSEIWGTPYYVAPERLNNAPEDFRSDIYSLGATLFHALAGRPPIEAETTSAGELRQLKAIPPDLHRIAPDVSRETARLVNRMLAPDPAHRFTSYAELVEQLENARQALAGTTQGAPGRRPLVIFGAVTLALLIAGSAYLYFARNPPRQTAVATPAPAAGPDNLAALQGRYEEARRQLLDGKYEAVATAFTRLATEAQGQQPLLSWIQIHRGLAALLQGKTGPARDAFQQLQNVSAPNPNGDQARFFSELGKILAAPGPISGPEIDAKVPHALASFLFGIKNWQLGEFAQAAPHFERYMATEAAGEVAWTNEYKPIAAGFVADYRLFTEWKQMPQRFENATDLRNAVAKVRGLEGKLKMQGALRDAFKDETKRLRAQLAKAEKAEKQAREAERARLLEQETPVWTAALANARNQVAVYDFTAALATVDAAELTEESLKQAQAAERKKIGWLVEWKTRLIDDLGTGRFAGAVTDAAGVSYVGAAAASADGVTLKLPPYGSAKVEWTKLAPATLLEMSRAFIQPGASDAADRQWLAAVFAHETGQKAAATQLSDDAVKAKPSYRSELGLFKGSAPPSR